MQVGTVPKIDDGSKLKFSISSRPSRDKLVLRLVSFVEEDAGTEPEDTEDAEIAG